MALYRIATDTGPALAAGSSAGGPERVLGPARLLDEALAGGAARLDEVARMPGQPADRDARLLAPLQAQEVWGAGVTYRRSRVAREREAIDSDPYERVFDAERPELFLKCLPGRAQGPDEEIGIRHDSGWDVPEPELTVVFDAQGAIAAFTIGNDVSSRAIERENPLYLPQAKIFTGSCAVGPCLVLPDELGDPRDLEIGLRVLREGAVVVDDATRTSELHRGLEELGEWLFAAYAFPAGVALMTGTGIVPDDDFTLQIDDVVEITIAGIGVLRNTVAVVGRSHPARTPGGGPRDVG
jgi:2-dehydro-3-deoxy-D-arabinonate dehydratase